MIAERQAILRFEMERKDAERRMRAAIDDVMDGGVTIRDAHRNRQVNREALREELEKRGWKDPHRRQRRES